jgi:hypothetical protein
MDGCLAEQGISVKCQDPTPIALSNGAPADGRYYVMVKMYSATTDSVYDLKVTANRAL